MDKEIDRHLVRLSMAPCQCWQGWFWAMSPAPTPDAKAAFDKAKAVIGVQKQEDAPNDLNNAITEVTTGPFAPRPPSSQKIAAAQDSTRWRVFGQGQGAESSLSGRAMSQAAFRTAT